MSRTRVPLGPDARPDLRGTSHAELARFCAESGELPYRPLQVLRWVYGRGVGSFAQMTDVPRVFRQALASHFRLQPLVRRHVVCGEDGTKKIVFGLADGESVESVLIPDRRRLTLCLSSQVGCGMGCRFCATARMGLRRNLAAGEIVGQVLDVRQLAGAEERRTNVVFLGLG